MTSRSAARVGFMPSESSTRFESGKSSAAHRKNAAEEILSLVAALPPIQPAAEGCGCVEKVKEMRDELLARKAKYKDAPYETPHLEGQIHAVKTLISALEKVNTDCVNSKTATYYNNGTSFEKGK